MHFLSLSFIFSLFHQDSWYYNYFQAVCLNVKLNHAKFLTEKYTIAVACSTINNCMFKVNNRNTIKQVTVKTPERHQLQSQWFPGVFIVNVEYISHLVLVFILLTFSR